MKHVFVSSTFKDMQFERDALHSIAAVNINASLSPYGEELYFADLRWGVNTTSLDSDDGCRRVLEVCLDEIDDCRPYMIVLVGERYGWIPDASLVRDTAAAKGIDIFEEMSVTQLEIEYGALLSNLCRGRVFFYFRDLDTSGMTEEQRRDYLAESERHRTLIEALKERIVEIYPEAVRHYSARFDPETQSVVGLGDFLSTVEKDLSGAFVADLEEEESLPWQERAIRSAERHFVALSRHYHPADRWPASYFDGTFCESETLMRFVKGEVGSGKSAFLAHNFTLASEEHDRRTLLPFVLGLDKYSSCEMDYFKILLYKLEELSGVAHTDTCYGISDLDCEIFDAILRLEDSVEGRLHSFIDNCSYELQNELSVRILDEHLRVRDVAYLGACEPTRKHLDFMIAYSAGEQNVMLPPWFDYSRTYVMTAIAEEDRIPLIKMILRQKHKELDDSVIAAITQKENACSPFYLKLAIDRLLMLDSTDFAEIRAMGDGMDNINRYQISVVEALPETAVGIATDLVRRVGARVNEELVMRVVGILTYGGTRLSEGYIESVFASQGWDYSSLEFALATRSLSAVLNYNPKDKSYAITNPDVISAIEELLDTEGYGYVARALHEHASTVADGFSFDVLFKTAAYVGVEFLSDFYVRFRHDARPLVSGTDWLVKRRGAEFAAEVLMRAVTECTYHDFSFVLLGIPTACLTIDDRDPYETLLQTVLDRFGALSGDSNDEMQNSFAAVAWAKLVSMRMKVNTSEVAPVFHAFVDAGYFDRPMTARARIWLDIVYYRFRALEAFYSMDIISPESYDPASESLVEEIEDTEERLRLHSHLYGSFAAYLQRAYVPTYKNFQSLAKRGYEMLTEYLKSGDSGFITADDMATMIDCLLDDRDDMLHSDISSVSAALDYMVTGQSQVNSRLLKYLPRILEASKYCMDGDGSDFSDETVNIMRRLCAVSRAVAGSAMTLDDCLFAVVQIEHSYDILSERVTVEEHLELIRHLRGFVNISMSISDGDPRVFYRCYLAIRKLFNIFDFYDMDDARAELLEFVSGLDICDPDAPILPELFAGSLLYRYSDRENYELLEHLRQLADTVEQDVEYAAYASAYSPELMSLRIDIRTPEEIAEDEAMLSFDSDSDEDEEFDLDSDDDDDAEDEDEDGEMSDEDMEAFLGELGLTLDDLFGKIDGIVGSDSDDDEQ